MLRISLSILGISFMALLLWWGLKSGYDTEAAMEEEYTITPLTRHWQKPIPHQVTPEGLKSLSAAECGQCHTEIYKEWQQSTHSVAWQDKQFQAELKKDNIYACLNCHIPLQNQQEYIVGGLINGDFSNPVLTPNPDFNRELQHESITCAACHIRDGSVIGTQGFADVTHATTIDTEFLSEELCMSCHNVAEQVTAVLVCTFETGDEWMNNWAREEGQNCISCHMPVVEREVLTGSGKIRKSHQHYFAGSGIPKFEGHEAKALEALVISTSELPAQYVVSNSIDFELKLKNEFAGHTVPTGDPERFYLIDFTLTNQQGDTVKLKQYRIGEEWVWYPEAKKISDNNLKPKEERAYSFNYIIAENDDLNLNISITKHRMTAENAAYDGILGEYPLSISIFNKNYFIPVSAPL